MVADKRRHKRHKTSDSGMVVEEKKPKPTSVFTLPPECWVIELLPLLGPKELCVLSRVCRYFYVLSTDNCTQ